MTFNFAYNERKFVKNTADNASAPIVKQMNPAIQQVHHAVSDHRRAGTLPRSAGLVALKVYKPRLARTFRNDSPYQEGRVILNRRSARAAAKRTDFGREVQSSLWTRHEFETLKVLHRAGADVPKPLGGTPGAVLMEWIGDADGEPASQLKDVELEPDEAQALFDRLLANIELWLACNVVHCDLSPYNLLYQPARLVAIDFPQASDPRVNPRAYSLLARDLDHVCRFFGRYGVQADAGALAIDLWDRFSHGLL